MIKKFENMHFCVSWFFKLFDRKTLYIQVAYWDRKKYSTCTGAYCNFKVKCSTKLL